MYELNADHAIGSPQLYSLFKQGSQDPPFADAPKPGMFDLTVRALASAYPRPEHISLYDARQGKAKYNAWKKVEDDGVSAKDAQEKYVKKVNSLKEKYGFNG